MRNALITFGAVGGAALTFALLGGALVDELQPPKLVGVHAARFKGRPDLGSNLCKIESTFEVDWNDAQAARQLGLDSPASGRRTALYPCGVLNGLLNDPRGCVLRQNLPKGWAKPAVGDLPDCAPKPVPDGGQ